MKRTRIKRVSRKRAAQGKAYLEFRLNLLARANYRCEHCRWKGALDVHHCAKPRARYLMSFDHCVVLCRDCHELVDAPYARGRLLVLPMGDQGFAFRMVWAASKFSMKTAPARRGLVPISEPPCVTRPGGGMSKTYTQRISLVNRLET